MTVPWNVKHVYVNMLPSAVKNNYIHWFNCTTGYCCGPNHTGVESHRLCLRHKYKFSVCMLWAVSQKALSFPSPLSSHKSLHLVSIFCSFLEKRTIFISHITEDKRWMFSIFCHKRVGVSITPISVCLYFESKFD